MEIKRNGSEASRKGPADWFTGSVRIDPLFQAPEPARVGGAHVTFEPGARTAWHTHPLGQTLIITSGLGWVQRTYLLFSYDAKIANNWRGRHSTSVLLS